MTAPSFFLKPSKMIINKKPNIMKKGFVKFYRDYGSHQWSNDPNTMAVLIRCLLNANLEDGYFCGRLIKSGSFATSLSSLSKQCGVSVQSVRTSLSRLSADQIISVETVKSQHASNTEDNTQPTTIKEQEYIKEQKIEREQEFIYKQQSLDFNIDNNFITSTIVDVPQSGGEGEEEEILEAEMIEETTEKGERNKKKAEAKDEKKYTVTHRCRLAFEQQYLQFKGEKYYYAAKDANAVKQLIDKIKTKMPDDLKETEDELVQNFTVFIQSILHSGKVERWILDNLSLPVINSKFNEIYSQLKNGTARQQQQRGTSDEYIQRIAAELAANGGLAF